MQNVKINNQALMVKEYQGQRVITLKEIDRVHGREEGTAKRNFNSNKKRFIEGVDYFKVILGGNEIRTQFGAGYTASQIIGLTQTGYLMLVKSLNDALAWKIQRELVNNYFNTHPVPTTPIVPTAPIKPTTPTTKVKPLLDDKHRSEIVDKMMQRSSALTEILELCKRYKTEKYLNPLRNTAWLLAVQISNQAYELGLIMEE